jgi:hypothetical protein
MRNRGWTGLLVLTVLLLAPLSFAQTFTGTIRGTVADQTGAVLPGAKVSVTDVNTGLTRSMTAGEGGEYDFPSLPIGTYRVEATAPNFKGETQTGLELHVNDIKVANFKLAVGASTEQVTVEANPIVVETQTGQVSGLIQGQQVRELPLNGRNFMQLTQLVPGVSAGNAFNSQYKGLAGSVSMSVSGSASNGNLWLIDGANNNDVGSNRTIVNYPSIDNIEEFKIHRNAYGPEFGQAAGGVVNIVTRAPGNQYHGTVFYFGRNDALNARDWFLGNANQPKAKLRRNDFGFTFGGPIKKDKLFFNFSQEFNREIRGFTRVATVPTEAERRGDFTGCLTANQPRPAAPVLAAVDPGAAAWFSIFPSPNTPNPCAGQNWVQSIPTKNNWRQESVRADWHINRSSTVMVRFTNESWKNPTPNGWNFFGLWLEDAFPSIEASWDQPSRSLSAKLTSTIGSTMVNDLSFGWTWSKIVTTPGGDQALNRQITTLIPAIYASDKTYQDKIPHPVYWGSPYGNLMEIAPWSNKQQLLTFKDDFSKVHGKHTFKLGVLFGKNLKNEYLQGGATSEAIQFSWIAGPANAAGQPNWGTQSGNWLYDMLSPGMLVGFQENQREPLGQVRWHDIEWYFADSWRIHPRLTLEYGFRWSFLREPFLADDKMGSFRPELYVPGVTDACNGVLLPAGSNVCEGQRGWANASNRSLKQSSNKLIAPRFGFAFDPTGAGRWAIRGGAGQFFQRERINPLLDMGLNPPFIRRTTGWRLLGDNLSADQGGAGSFFGGFGTAGYGLDTSSLVPNNWQWNFSVEREVARNTKLEVAYVGSHGVHLLSGYDINQVAPANRVAYAQARGNNPNDGALAALRPYSNLGDAPVWIYGRNASSIYHSLQMMFSGRRANLTWQGSYTFSKLLASDSLSWTGSPAYTQDPMTDISQPSLDRGLAQLNRPHIFAFNVVYMLPKFQDSAGLVKHVLGNWEIGTIVTAGSGNSLSIFNGVGQDFAGTGYQQNQRPNRVLSQPCSASGLGYDRAQIINPSAFTLAGIPIGGFGTARRGTCEGPRYANADLAFYKNFLNVFKSSKLLPEGMKVQFRLELFNAFNTPQFRFSGGPNLNYGGTFVTNTGGTNTLGGNPTSIVSSSPAGGFGRADSTTGGREIQYALKFIF